MRKKILITTFHRAENYGAQLQCYALQEVLNNKFDCDVKILDYRNPQIEKPYKLFNFDKKNTLKNIKEIIKNIVYGSKRIQRKKNFQEFINKKLKLTESIYEIEEIKKVFDNIDAFITGSDQVWSRKIVGEVSNLYTLNFEYEKAKKISYAASIGNAKEVDDYRKDYLKIGNLDYISVREDDAKEELKKIIDKKIEVVLDPTMLLKLNDWEEKIKNVKINNDEKYILAYVVEKDEEYIKIVNELSKRTGLKVLHFGVKNPGYENILKTEYIRGPLEFVNYIKNADYVVSTSFHATVFSVIFNKKFFIVPHRKTGARVTNLLKKLNLSKRVCNCFDDFKKLDYDFETDWDEVNRKLDVEREKSLEWLNSALNN